MIGGGSGMGQKQEVRMPKKPHKQALSRRRGRDSNPRHGETVYRISSPATNPVPLSTAEDRKSKPAPSRSKKARGMGQQRDRILPESVPNLRYGLLDAKWQK